MQANIFLKVQDLKKLYPIYGGLLQRVIGHVRAVDGVSFEIRRNETFGVVGESGCGKTTLARTLLRLIEPTEGKIIFDGIDITGLEKRDLRFLRKQIQIIFQDPYTALHPRKTIKEIVGEPLEIHKAMNPSEMLVRVKEVLENVGLAEEHLYRYPHEFSGGQRQRIMIARAIVLNPRFLVLDEPTSALDVSVQARILNLLKNLQRRLNLTYMLISHNLSIVDYMSDRIAVMYLGKFVEVGSRRQIFQEPFHPYTQALLSAVPIADLKSRDRKRIILSGEVPSPSNPPPGCRFHTRCLYVQSRCKKEEPPLEHVNLDHYVACHYWKEIQEDRTVLFQN